ncbi:MAG: heme-binding domain-containing protein [Alphaproteobacteria bacterium]|nr:heme-binding domain-containing protein [Alphaproteobacteria bacterium]
MTRRLVSRLAVAAATVFALAQLVPYRVQNPPVVEEVRWDSPRTAELARRACFDCHSHEVVVPWYGHVAPVAWVVRHHVDEGRAALDFSDVAHLGEEAHEAGEVVAEGEMPPAYYTALHPEARLTDAEKRALIDGLDATLRAAGGGSHEDADEEEDDGDHDD